MSDDDFFRSEMFITGYFTDRINASRSDPHVLGAVDEVESVNQFKARSAKMLDMLQARHVEVKIDQFNKLWINIDGACAVRIGHVGSITLDYPGLVATIEQEKQG